MSWPGGALVICLPSSAPPSVSSCVTVEHSGETSLAVNVPSISRGFSYARRRWRLRRCCVQLDRPRPHPNTATSSSSRSSSRDADTYAWHAHNWLPAGGRRRADWVFLARCALVACVNFSLKFKWHQKGWLRRKAMPEAQGGEWGCKKGDSLCCVSVCVCVGVDSDNCDDIFCTCSLSKHAHISLLLPSTPHTHHLSHLSSATSTWLIVLPIIGTHFGFKLQIIATIRDRSSTSPPPTADLLINKIYSRQFHLPQRR